MVFVYIHKDMQDGAYVLSELDAITKNGFSQKAIMRGF